MTGSFPLPHGSWSFCFAKRKDCSIGNTRTLHMLRAQLWIALNTMRAGGPCPRSSSHFLVHRSSAGEREDTMLPRLLCFRAATHEHYCHNICCLHGGIHGCRVLEITGRRLSRDLFFSGIGYRCEDGRFPMSASCVAIQNPPIHFPAMKKGLVQFSSKLLVYFFLFIISLLKKGLILK